MNPEFQRNLWLEAGPRRLAWTGVVLAAIYGAVLLLARDHPFSALGIAGAAVFVAAALIWGARAAGGAVAEEVRQRTWDFQRLSALTPWEMTWGKLFGASSLSWLAGGTGLALTLIWSFADGHPERAVQWLIGGLSLAVLLQAGSMAGALVNVRRARAEGRVPNFRFTLGGIVGLMFVIGAVQRAFPTQGQGLGGPFGWLTGARGDFHWWGLPVAADWFATISLAAFAGWALVAAWRLMRLELQMENGPWYWPGFVLFAGVWAAGMIDTGGTARFAVAGAVFAICAYLGAFADPADRVRLRQFMDALRRWDIKAMLPTTPLVVAPLKLSVYAVVGIAIAPLFGEGAEPSAVLALAALAFLLRDLAIVAYFRFGPRPGRGDFGAALALFLAYFVGGVVGMTSGQGGLALFAPSLTMPAISVFAGAVQAAIVWFLAWKRIQAPEKSEA